MPEPRTSSDSAAPAATLTKPAPDAKPTTRHPSLWNVVVLDSDDHSYEYVIEMMTKVFRHSTQRAFDIAVAIDTRGRAICQTVHRELAELRVEQIRAFGPDARIASSTTAMRCFIEPAADDDHDDDDNDR